jgi:hypothetical protein
VEAIRSKKESNIALQCWRLPSGENNFVEGKLGNRLDVDSSSGRNGCRQRNCSEKDCCYSSMNSDWTWYKVQTSSQTSRESGLVAKFEMIRPRAVFIMKKYSDYQSKSGVFHPSWAHLNNS